jgi:hypothetical protein
MPGAARSNTKNELIDGVFLHTARGGRAKTVEHCQFAVIQIRQAKHSGIAATATDHRQGPCFIDRYVFPDGELVPLNTSLGEAERSGFELRDVESLRGHCALTLHHWVRRQEAHADEVRRITDETTYRIWRLYMAASAHRFRLNRLNLYQKLLAKRLHRERAVCHELVLTRTGTRVVQTLSPPRRVAPLFWNGDLEVCPSGVFCGFPIFA